MTGLQPLFGSLYDFANKRFNFKRPPKLFLKQDDENAMDTFGKTAFYNPNEESITIFVSQRHPKDILRSFAHELIHHGQNLNGELAPEKCGEMGPGYAQNNEYMRDLEMKAFRDGNLCFRDWEDTCKQQRSSLKENKNQKENGKMTVKISKDMLKGIIGKILKEQEDNMSRELDGGMSTPDIASYPQIPGMSDPEVEEKGDKQERLLGKAGFRSMEQLQKMVGADVTGVYDQQTMDKIVRFQNRLGFVGDEADGLFGPATARALKRSGTASDIASMDRALAKLGEPDSRLGQFDADVAAGMGDIGDVLGKVGEPFEDEDLAKMSPDEEENATAVREAHCVPAKRDEDGEKVEEAGCGSAKRDDELEEAKKCPHCDGDAPRSECICGKMNESEELEEKMGVTRQGKKCKCGDPGCGGCEALEEAVPTVSADELDDDDVKDGPGDMSVKDGKLVKVKEAFKIQTPEQEKNLYESRFGKRNDELFNKLTKLWSKSK
jgi:peptidoglycan hydrolase-like protein with peptidoglycan-binding domain